ncbi:MAG: glycosyltransferase [Planctomycetota bacterium]
MAAPTPIVSIVIPTLARAESLATLLDSIDAHATVPHEVIAVTVERDTPTQQLLATRPHITNLVDPERTGFVRAANRGFAAATAEFVCQLNDDCLLMPHTLGNALNFLHAPAHASVGLAAFFHDTPVRRNIAHQIVVEDIAYAVLHVRGLLYANFGLCRRELGERLGWFDERYVMYGADPDFSLKVWHHAGLSVAPCPGSLVRHAELDDDRAAEERAAQSSDNAALFEKWGI